MSALSKILSDMYTQAIKHLNAPAKRTLRNGLTIAMRLDPPLPGGERDGVRDETWGNDLGDLHLAIYRHKQTASSLEMKIILQNLPPHPYNPFNPFKKSVVSPTPAANTTATSQSGNYQKKNPNRVLYDRNPSHPNRVLYDRDPCTV